MIEKCFRIFSNSEQSLTAEAISEALLHQITLNPAKGNAVFGVVEAKGSPGKKEKNKMGLEV